MNLGLKELIAKIALSSSIKEAAELYKIFEGILKDYVFFSTHHMQPSVIVSTSNLKNPTHRFNLKLMAVFKDKRILYSGRLAKYLAAFFKMSRSSSVCLS